MSFRSVSFAVLFIDSIFLTADYLIKFWGSALSDNVPVSATSATSISSEVSQRFCINFLFFFLPKQIGQIEEDLEEKKGEEEEREIR